MVGLIINDTHYTNALTQAVLIEDRKYHGLHYPISSKGSFICTILTLDSIYHGLIYQQWLEREIDKRCQCSKNPF